MATYTFDLNMATWYIHHFVSNDQHNCLLQKAADYLVSWTNVNGMVRPINTSKTQEMVVYFGKQLCVDDIPLI